jgi:hypothetical protein
MMQMAECSFLLNCSLSTIPEIRITHGSGVDDSANSPLVGEQVGHGQADDVRDDGYEHEMDVY